VDDEFMEMIDERMVKSSQRIGCSSAYMDSEQSAPYLHCCYIQRMIKTMKISVWSSHFGPAAMELDQMSVQRFYISIN